MRIQKDIANQSHFQSQNPFTVQEREAQTSYKQTMKQLRTKADQALLEQQRAALARAEEEEKKKAEERKKKLLEQKTIQGTQVNNPGHRKESPCANGFCTFLFFNFFGVWRSRDRGRWGMADVIKLDRKQTAETADGMEDGTQEGKAEFDEREVALNHAQQDRLSSGKLTYR